MKFKARRRTEKNSSFEMLVHKWLNKTRSLRPRFKDLKENEERINLSNEKYATNIREIYAYMARPCVINIFWKSVTKDSRRHLWKWFCTPIKNKGCLCNEGCFKRMKSNYSILLYVCHYYCFVLPRSDSNERFFERCK